MFCMKRSMHFPHIHVVTQSGVTHANPIISNKFRIGEQEVSYVIPVLFLSNSLGASLLPKTVEQVSVIKL